MKEGKGAGAAPRRIHATEARRAFPDQREAALTFVLALVAEAVGGPPPGPRAEACLAFAFGEGPGGRRSPRARAFAEAVARGISARLAAGGPAEAVAQAQAACDEAFADAASWGCE